MTINGITSVVINLLLLIGRCSSVNNLVWPDPMAMHTGHNILPVSKLRIIYNGPQSKIIDAAIERTYKNMFVLGCVPDSRNGLNILIVNTQKGFDIKQTHSVPEDEFYSLRIRDGETFGVLNSYTVLGALRGLDTFSQLIQVVKEVPIWDETGCGISQYYIETPIFIRDQPYYSYRGLLVDTSRHFMPKSVLKKVIQGMEASKLNVFHWHIVDSQSFPIKSQVLPFLSDQGAYSEFEVYTIQDIKEIVEYAEFHGIRVMPEFDVPGHAYSWRGSGLVVCADARPWEIYCAEPPCGQLDISKNETFKMLETFLREMATVFPSESIHLGHDEVNRNCYLQDSNIMAKINSGIDLNRMLQNFQDKAQEIAKGIKKIPVFWEEVILDFPTKVPNHTIIQSWKGSESTALILEKGFQVIVSDSTAWYLDCGHGNWVTGNNSWCDPFHTWAKVYMFDPASNLSEQLQTNLLGGETAAWSEIAGPSNILSLIFPRASAAAESLWSTHSKRDWRKAAKRMDRFVRTLHQRGIDASPIWPTYCSMGNCLD